MYPAAGLIKPRRGRAWLLAKRSAMTRKLFDSFTGRRALLGHPGLIAISIISIWNTVV
jgi:hypothetical protein